MSLSYKTAGESHGPELVSIIEGIPAGLSVSARDIDRDLARRQLGHGRGGRMKIEKDQVIISSGVRNGLTLGSPVGLRIVNADWRNWTEVMAVEADGKDATAEPVTVPRPGHADLPGIQKFGFRDMRNVLERASARETASRVAVGALARKLLAEFTVQVFSHVVRIGEAGAAVTPGMTAEDLSAADESPVRCLDRGAADDMVREIDRARENGESLGGVFEVVALGLVPGLGSSASGPERLGGRIGGALMSIPAIKGAEIGDGFQLARRPGSQAHDEIFFDPDRGYYRRTNRAGGLEGGMTNGEILLARACMKPIPTLTRPLRSIDINSGAGVPAHKERSDVCAVPAAAVVGEAMVAIELARVMLEKFGGDSLDDMRVSFNAYRERLEASWPRP
ncbi:chorismate synthase [bacterium BMS3Abin01]|nr:chorismate synthase [bacterium BMS3Abin01]